MTDSYMFQDVTAALARMAAALRDNADYLTELDQKLGDGDLGITAKKAAEAIDAHIIAGATDAADLGKFVASAGMAVNRVASSTMGTLLATAAMRAGKIVKDSATLSPAQLADMLDAAAQGMRERGQAKLGDKTVLDALCPAAEAFRLALEAGQGLDEAGSRMAAAAEAGRDKVTPLRSRIGRAGWIGERTEGLVDPGCELCVLSLRALAGR